MEDDNFDIWEVSLDGTPNVLTFISVASQLLVYSF
jgi:hypothetical protein